MLDGLALGAHGVARVMRWLLLLCLLATSVGAAPLWPRLPSETEIDVAIQRLFTEYHLQGEQVSTIRLRDAEEPDRARSAQLLLLFTVIDRPSASYIPPDPPKYFVVALGGDGNPFEFGLGNSFNSEAERSAWIERLFQPGPPRLGGSLTGPSRAYLRGWGDDTPTDRVQITLTHQTLQDGQLKLEGNLNSPSPITSALFMRNRGGALTQGYVQHSVGRFQAECVVEPGITNEFKLTFDQQNGPGSELTISVVDDQISVAGTASEGEVGAPPVPPTAPPSASPEGNQPDQQPEGEATTAPPDPPPASPGEPRPGGARPPGETPKPPVSVSHEPGSDPPLPGAGLAGVGKVPGPADLAQTLLGTTLPALISVLGSILVGAASQPPATPPRVGSEPQQPSPEQQAAQSESADLGTLTNKLNEVIQQKQKQGYYIKNTSLVAKVWNQFPILSSARDWVTGYQGGQCGEAHEWAREWAAGPLRETFGEGALIEPIVIQNGYLPNAVNHISTRAILPSGRRVVACFWDGMGQGKITLMSEKEWEHLWTKRCSGVRGTLALGKVRGEPGLDDNLPDLLERQKAWREHCQRLGVNDDSSNPPTLDPMVIARSDKENALKECIARAGGDTQKGIEAFLNARISGDPAAAQKVRQARELWAKSFLREPW